MGAAFDPRGGGMSRPSKEQAAAEMRRAMECAQVASRIGLFATAATALDQAAAHARAARAARDDELAGEVG